MAEKAVSILCQPNRRYCFDTACSLVLCFCCLVITWTVVDVDDAPMMLKVFSQTLVACVGIQYKFVMVI